jgi:hypothetical protein
MDRPFKKDAAEILLAERDQEIQTFPSNGSNRGDEDVPRSRTIFVNSFGKWRVKILLGARNGSLTSFH